MGTHSLLAAQHPVARPARRVPKHDACKVHVVRMCRFEIFSSVNFRYVEDLWYVKSKVVLGKVALTVVAVAPATHNQVPN